MGLLGSLVKMAGREAARTAYSSVRDDVRSEVREVARNEVQSAKEKIAQTNNTEGMSASEAYAKNSQDTAARIEELKRKKEEGTLTPEEAQELAKGSLASSIGMMTSLFSGEIHSLECTNKHPLGMSADYKMLYGLEKYVANLYRNGKGSGMKLYSITVGGVSLADFQNVQEKVNYAKEHGQEKMLVGILADNMTVTASFDPISATATFSTGSMHTETTLDKVVKLFD